MVYSYIACVTERFGREETKKHFHTIIVLCNQKCREGKENLFAEFGLCWWWCMFGQISTDLMYTLILAHPVDSCNLHPFSLYIHLYSIIMHCTIDAGLLLVHTLSIYAISTNSDFLFTALAYIICIVLFAIIFMSRITVLRKSKKEYKNYQELVRSWIS